MSSKHEGIKWGVRLGEAGVGMGAGGLAAAGAKAFFYEPKETAWRIRPHDGGLERRDLTDAERRERLKQALRWGKRGAIAGAILAPGGSKLLRNHFDKLDDDFEKSALYATNMQGRDEIIGKLLADREEIARRGVYENLSTIKGFTSRVKRVIDTLRGKTPSEDPLSSIDPSLYDEIEALNKIRKDEPDRVKLMRPKAKNFRDKHLFGLPMVQYNEAKRGTDEFSRPNPKASLRGRMAHDAELHNANDLADLYDRWAKEHAKKKASERAAKKA